MRSSSMLTAVEGVFKNGHVELRETPENIQEARVVVTFLEPATKAAEAAKPAVAETTRTAVTEAPKPTIVQTRSAPTAWEHLLNDDFPATPDERLRAFRALVASLPEAPAVPLAALDRENLYP
jgi:hypothetical protein